MLREMSGDALVCVGIKGPCRFTSAIGRALSAHGNITEMSDSFEPRWHQDELSGFTVDRLVASKLA
jgi:hypothetical protein